MKSRASIADHPIHPMLVVFPVGLWIFSFVMDLLFLGTGNLLWYVLAFYTMVGGIIGALLAAVAGSIDLYAFRKNDNIRRTGLVHMGINLSLVVLFLINAIWRTQAGPLAAGGQTLLSAFSVGLLAVSGWLGGHMVYVYGAGVSPESMVRREPAAIEEGEVPVHVERRRASNVPYYGPERRRRA